MRVPLNDLSRGVQPGDVAAVRRVAESGWYVHGPEHEGLEWELAAALGVAHCAGVASGTDALEIALRALAVGTGPVVTAANAGGYTSVAARRAGLPLRYADVDESTHGLSAATVAEHVEGASAVVVTHLYGRMAAVEELAELCRSAGVPLVEDCAQAAGARRSGVAAGATGDAATFSFYPTKNLAALGDGGAVVTSRDDVDGQVRRLRQYGWSGKYLVEQEGGRNSRLDELQAAVLRGRLVRLDADNARRREVVARYVEAAAGSPLDVLPAEGEEAVAHLAVGTTADRDGVRAQLAAAGIATDVHYPTPDHRQPAWAAEHAGTSLPVTERLAEQVLTLPCFPGLTDEEVDAVCSALRALA